MILVGAAFRPKGQVPPQALFWQEEREFPSSSLCFHLSVFTYFQKFFNFFLGCTEFIEVVRVDYSLVNTCVTSCVSSLKSPFFSPSKQVSKTWKTSSRDALRAPLFLPSLNISCPADALSAFLCSPSTVSHSSAVVPAEQHFLRRYNMASNGFTYS